MTTRLLLIGATVVATASLVGAQTAGQKPSPSPAAKPAAPAAPARPLSPTGSGSAQVDGHWTQGAQQQYTAGRGSFEGGKWIDISYGRPLKRGRDVFGSGDNFGKDLLVGADVWRAGANVTTQLTSDVPINIGGKTLAANTTYTVFIDLKPDNWTFILSTLVAQKKYDPAEKVQVFGAYNYARDKDVVRMQMTVERLPHVFEELSWQFLDMTATTGRLAVVWDNYLASVPFTVAG